MTAAELEEIGAAYWKLHTARELIRETLPAMALVDAYETYREAFYAVDKSMDLLKKESP
jgi:hypothetical protein